MTRERKKVTLTEALQEDEDDRGTWGNQCEFFLSCLGYAVGFGNVWRFPYLCYKNGGAVFLIPYVIMLLCAGLPLFFMELALGQYVSLGPSILFPKLAPLFSGLGWGMVMVSFLVSIYYNIILAWAFYYTFASFTSELPWSHCNNDFNSVDCYTLEEGRKCRNESGFFYNKTCVDIDEYCRVVDMIGLNETFCQDPTNDSVAVAADKVVPRISSSEDYFQNGVLGVTGTTWKDFGEIRWELVGCLALGWLVVGACLAKGVKSSGKVVYFTALFPYVVLIILFGRGITLEGSRLGIDFYFLKPDLTRLKEVEVWADAATQIFYSLGSSFGGLITLASYNRFKNNCMRDAIIIAFANCSTSVFAGFVIFSILGFLASELGVEVQDVASSGSGLAFVVYPAAVIHMPVPPVWSILFFLMLITLGLDSQFTMVETVTTALFDHFEWLRVRKALVVGVTCLTLFLAGLTMCLQGGVYMFELFFFYSSSTSVIILAIIEVVAVQHVYGFRTFMGHLQQEVDIYIPRPLYAYWAATWTIITPLALVVILGFSVAFAVPAYWGSYVFPNEVQGLGWLLCFSSVVFFPLGILCTVLKGNRTKADLLKSSPDFCPGHVRKQREAKSKTKAHIYSISGEMGEPSAGVGGTAQLSTEQDLDHTGYNNNAYLVTEANSDQHVSQM
ncbi:sodium- and chloride-dependent glycine transporter 1-like [Panulirus ornatus]|uniref:sodium- and chloride-dependent glycine transporter 1-like n=1 Tax=Panulirus ornatus TaxID=150431 RepID=UPI003A867C9F